MLLPRRHRCATYSVQLNGDLAGVLLPLENLPDDALSSIGDTVQVLLETRNLRVKHGASEQGSPARGGAMQGGRREMEVALGVGV